MCVSGQLEGWHLAFHHVGSKALTQTVRLGGRDLYLLSHLTGPCSFLLPKN